jgi:RNA polymerase primary sigma factor
MRNYRIEDEDKGIAVERPIAVNLPDTRAIGIDSDDEAHSERLEDAIAAEASVEATAVSPPSCQDGAAAMAASRPDDASRLGDPLDIYFRDVGYDELLSRDEELALAKRIDAARQKLLARLCRIPLIVARVSTWGEALREGRLRLSQFVDAPPPGEGPEAAESDLLGDGQETGAGGAGTVTTGTGRALH